MATIRREDGTLFITPSYRESLSTKKRSLLKKEIQMMSGNYGEYVYIRRKNNAQYDVAFNNEAGYPLGETLWRYLDKPENLIYCEESENEAILVIVKSGSVYLDAKLPMESIGEELIALRSQKNKFHIYIFGNVPISETKSTTKFFFDESHIASFTKLTESFFEKLPVYDNIQLLPIKKAFNAAGMGPISIKIYIGPLIFLLVIYMGWNYLNTHKKDLPKVFIGVVDPYVRYTSTLTSPAPSQEIDEFVKFTSTMFNIPGVDILSVSLDVKHGFSASIDPNNISLELIKKKANENHIDMIVDNNGATLTLPDFVSDRQAPKSIYNLQSSLRITIDKLKIILPSAGAIQLSEETSYSEYKEVPLVINFNDITLGTLVEISKAIDGLPLIFNGMTANVNNGFLTGKINLTLVGN